MQSNTNKTIQFFQCSGLLCFIKKVFSFIETQLNEQKSVQLKKSNANQNHAEFALYRIIHSEIFNTFIYREWTGGTSQKLTTNVDTVYQPAAQ